MMKVSNDMTPTNYSRKEFLKLLGLGTASLTFSGWKSSEITKEAAPIAIQLYTVRREIEKDLEGTIHKIAEMGFVGIETYALPANITLAQAAKVFKDCGLKVVSMHTELPADDQIDTILKMADAYECEYAIYAGWPQEEKYKNLDATEQTADMYNEAAAFLKTKGLQFGLHNHWWEFEKTDGIYPFYYLLENLDPKVFFEIDTYWVKTGGQNPVQVVADFGKRSPFLHIKDGPAIKGKKAYEQVPAGSGTMDFPSIVKAGSGDKKWMIVEFDEYAGNIFEGVQGSYTYLTKNDLAKGKV
jgi:sugar phosphate isomerase/epimerase